MSNFLSRKRIGVILVASLSIIVIVALTFEPSFIIRINGEPWYVTGTKAVQEWDYSFYMVGVAKRTILYPGQAYDRYLEINITSTDGTINLSVEYAEDILYEISDASAVIVTLSMNSSNPRITISPCYSYNMTLKGYIKAYCWIPSESIPSYYLRNLFGGGD